MQMNQLSEQEQVLVNAFRNMHPERRQIMVSTAIKGALDYAKTGPKLALVSDNTSPIGSGNVSRRSGGI